MQFYRVTVQMKAIEQYFFVLLFTMTYKVAQRRLGLWMKSYRVAIQMTAIEYDVVCFSVP